jgi:hypothetical protein
VAFSKTSRAGASKSGFSAFRYRAAMRQLTPLVPTRYGLRLAALCARLAVSLATRPSGLISTPMLARPVLRAATIAVPTR